MKFFEDLLSSIAGNAKAKVNDPSIGAFIGSWVVCNWYQLAILIWGEGDFSVRVSRFSEYLKEMNFFSLNSLFFIPLLMSFAYTILFPWFSLFFKSIQKNVNDRLHKQAVEIEILKTKNQEELNKRRLLANPDKKFLEQNIQLDIDNRKKIIDQKDLRSKRIKARADAARAEADKSRAEADAAIAKTNKLQSEEKAALLQAESKAREAEIEKNKFILANAKLTASIAANRFPVSYNFLLELEEELKGVGVKLSISGISKLVSGVFGYKSFYDLINDEGFINDNVSEIEYLYYSNERIAKIINDVLQKEDLGSDKSNLVYDAIISVFSNFDFKFCEETEFKEILRDFADENSFELINNENLSGLMAESDTVYDEFYIEELESIEFHEDGATATFIGAANGSHRKDSDIPGRSINFKMEVEASTIFGSNAINEIKISNAYGDFEDYAEVEHYEEDENLPF